MEEAAVSAKRARGTDLQPSDFHRRPMTEEEFAAWEAMTPEQRALFGNILSSTFRWVLHVQGERFQEWLEAAVKLGCIRPGR
jgi:hypothetical protein